MRISLALALVLVACAVDPTIAPRDCTPGQTVECACPGVNGVQTCDRTGHLGSCECRDAGPARDVVADVAQARDVVLEDRVDAVPAPDVVDAGELVDLGAMGPDVAPVDAGPAEDVRDAGVCPGVDVQSDPLNCGACGNVCPSNPHEEPGCTVGRCFVARCSTGYLNCDANVTNGCETNINTDRMNCGRCRNVCPGSQTCRNGVCG